MSYNSNNNNEKTILTQINGKTYCFSPARREPCDIHGKIFKVKIDSDFYDSVCLVESEFISDKLCLIPNSKVNYILSTIDVFKKSKSIYKSLGLIYKRGYLLYGIPGTGKTTIISEIARMIVNDGGVVLISDHPVASQRAIKNVRSITDALIVNVIEDIDVTIDEYAEKILSLLDGDSQVENIVHIATTNYIEKLDERFVKRPSRFDEVIEIGLFNQEQRKRYIGMIAPADTDEELIEKMANASDGFTVAHLRELVLSICLFKNDLDVTINRLKTMTGPCDVRKSKSAGFVEKSKKKNYYEPIEQSEQWCVDSVPETAKPKKSGFNTN